MMRIAGRGADGTAKAVKTTNEGVIIVGQYAERRQLAVSASVVAGSEVDYEIPVSSIVSSQLATLIFTSFELSWHSSDGMGREGCEIIVFHHRVAGDLTYNSVSMKVTLDELTGVKEGDSGYFTLSNDFAQNIKNNFITIRFKNNTTTNKGIYYPTIILK